MGQAPDHQVVLDLDFEVDLRLTLGLLRGAGTEGVVSRAGPVTWRATRTPEGPATGRYRVEAGRLHLEAWGPGAGWLGEHARTLVGAGDDVSSFEPRHDVLRDIHRRSPGLRMPRSEAVFESLIFAILEQKVTGVQAAVAIRAVVRRLGEPAPGPAELWLVPTPARLMETPYWAFHELQVERRRADTLRRVASVAGRMEEAVGMDRQMARERLQAVSGVGPWTASEVAQRALGDADAVSVGDYHIPSLVTWALAGEARGTDERMLELLEPYRGHRARVQRLLLMAGVHAPRFGPRQRIRWL